MSIQSNFPAIKPTLLLDFANTEELDGRITFTRASTATYYGTQTAKAEENLLLRSQDFNEAYWTKTNATVTANSTAAPDGTTTAETLAVTSAGTGSRISVAPGGLSGTNTISIFAKADTKTVIQVCDNTSATAFVNFDLSGGAVGSTGGGATGVITALANGWYRCSTTFTWANEISFHVVDSSTSVRREAPATTGALFIWGAQAENRSTVTAYTPTTTQPITNYIPVLQTAASGVARFDHNPTTFESLGLLIEEQRTNLLTYSEQFDNAAWTKTRSSITANTIVAPDGTLTGDKLVEDTTATSSHVLIRSSISFTSGTVYTISAYVKAAERTSLRLLFGVGFSASPAAFFNISTGVISANPSGNSSSASIAPVGNGWYRVSVTATADSTTSVGEFTATLVTGTNTVSYTGDGYSGIFIWGAQLESGSFSTSYIQTVASQVTRAADAASMTGANFSSWYRADEGTLYAESSTYSPTATRSSFYIGDGTGNNRHMLFAGAAGGLFAITVASGTAQSNPTSGTVASANSFYKISYAYAVNNFGVSGNGAAVGTDTSGILPVEVNQALIGNYTSTTVLNGHIKKLAFYPGRLSNTQLQALTQN
jgi:hypothetical protein